MDTSTASIWQKSKLLIKGLLITGLVLLLLIPTFFVKNLIKEREERQQEAFTEVRSKWAGKQRLTGPILVVPYDEVAPVSNGTSNTLRKLAYFLPDRLDMASTVKPEKRYRGIFQVMLYSAETRISGRFNPLPLAELQLEADRMHWNEAYVCFGLADIKGLKEDIRINWNGTAVSLNPTSINNAVMQEGFQSSVSVAPGTPIEFSSTIKLNGSEQLLFTPIGKETNVKMVSNWPDPSFTGDQLPDHQINDSGFVASWKSLAHNRRFPQAWKTEGQNIQAASFGADLFIPVNGYQKTMRSIKYAVLCIVLTFAAFFLMETVNKKSVHPFQYALIGLALVLFYTLLLSISEYTGFNTAYIISAAATVGLIGWFVRGLLQSGRLSSILALVLVLLYAYLFSILQLQDYSLLLGSIGLFLTLAIIMHFSKRIRW